MKRLSPGKKAIVIYSALVLASGVIALALLGPVMASAAIIGSMIVSGLIGTIAYVVYANREYMEATNV